MHACMQFVWSRGKHTIKKRTQQRVETWWVMADEDVAVSETRRRLRPLQCMAYSLSSLFIFSVWHGRYMRSCNLHSWHGRRHETNKEVIYGSTVIYAVCVFHPFAPPSHGLFLIYTILSSFVVFLLCSSSMAWSSHGWQHEVLKSTPFISPWHGRRYEINK